MVATPRKFAARESRNLILADCYSISTCYSGLITCLIGLAVTRITTVVISVVGAHKRRGNEVNES